MDVVLGVAVTGPVARLALVGAGAGGSDVIDQSVVDLANNPIEQLTETVVGTNRLLANENHRLVGTRLCWTDHSGADQLRPQRDRRDRHRAATPLVKAPDAILIDTSAMPLDRVIDRVLEIIQARS